MRHKSESRDKALLGVAPDPVICDAIHHVDLLRFMRRTSRQFMGFISHTLFR